MWRPSGCSKKMKEGKNETSVERGETYSVGGRGFHNPREFFKSPSQNEKLGRHPRDPPPQCSTDVIISCILDAGSLLLTFPRQHVESGCSCDAPRELNASSEMIIIFKLLENCSPRYAAGKKCFIPVSLPWHNFSE